MWLWRELADVPWGEVVGWAVMVVAIVVAVDVAMRRR